MSACPPSASTLSNQALCQEAIEPAKPAPTNASSSLRSCSECDLPCQSNAASPLKLSSRQADDPLLRLQFAIIIAPGNLRPCRGQTYVPVFGLLLPNRTSMVCI